MSEEDEAAILSIHTYYRRITTGVHRRTLLGATVLPIFHTVRERSHGRQNESAGPDLHLGQKTTKEFLVTFKC